MAAFDASRWADAFLAAAGSRDAEAFSALEAIAQEVRASGLSNGSFAGAAAEARLKAATASFSGLSPGAETARRLTILLARAGRLSRIGAVVAAVGALRDARGGIVRALVESAFPIDEGSRKALENALKKRKGASEIILEEKIDPELLGGVRVLIGNERIDGSLRRRLESLAAATEAAKRGGGTW